MKVNIFLFLLLFSHFISAQEVSIYPNGIHLPTLVQDSLPAITSPGHILFNLTNNRPEIFTQNFQWEGFHSDRIVDKDRDTEVLINEGPKDNIEFRTDNTRRLTVSSNAGGIGNLILHGNSNTHIGASAGRDASSATHNIAIGPSALANNEAGSYNIAIGSDALKNMNTQEGQTQFGRYNTAIGSKALELADGFSGENVAVGYEAGASGGSQSVFLGYQAGKNASDLSNALYINNTEGDSPLIYGDFSQGKVVINSNGGTVEDALLINGISSQHGPMRVKVDGATKFRVHKNGGLSIGTHAAPFDNGLKVANLDEDGPPTPLYADDRGNVTRRSGIIYTVIPAMDLREQRWNGTISLMRPHDYRIPARPPSPAPSLMVTGGAFAPVELPHGSKIKNVIIRYIDPETPVIDGSMEFQFVKTNIYDENDITILVDHSSEDGGSDDIQTHSFDINNLELVDNQNFYYAIVFDYWATGDPLKAGVVLATTVGYEH